MLNIFFIRNYIFKNLYLKELEVDLNTEDTLFMSYLFST